MQYEPLIISHLRKEIRNGYSPIVLFVGKQRTGKTFCALLFAYIFDKRFDTDKQMIFNIADFIEAVWKYEHKVLVLDECGTYLDPTMHLQIQQRAYAHVIQSQAYKQNIIFLITPHAFDFGKYHRKDVDSIVSMISRNEFGSMAKIYSVDTWRANINEIKMRMKHQETLCGIPQPPNHIKNVYLGKYQGQQKGEILEKERIRVLVKNIKDQASNDKVMGKSISSSQDKTMFHTNPIK